MTTIHVHGGMANRLRAILSWRHVCGPLTVSWLPDGQVHYETWDQVFRPLSGVEFVYRPIAGAISTYEPYQTAQNWRRAYLDLIPIRPAPTIDGPYCAMHMRRTDAIQYQTSELAHETDDVFIKWAMNEPYDTVFLATDNGTTQRNVLSMGKRVLIHEPILEHDRQNEAEVRNTGLLHAWWDIETCARANSFKGSGVSSFTNLIHTLRGLR